MLRSARRQKLVAFAWIFSAAALIMMVIAIYSQSSWALILMNVLGVVGLLLWALELVLARRRRDISSSNAGARSPARRKRAKDQVTATGLPPYEIEPGYNYDANGNLLTGKTADGTGTATYTYNGANQMTSATISGTTTTYTYAGSSQNALLSSSTAGGATVNYSYGAPGLATYQNGSATSHLFADPTTGQAVMLTTSIGTAALYINDGLGNIAGLTIDGSGPAFRESYDPYGAGTLTPGTGNGYTQNPYLFKDGLADRATGLLKFGARW